MTGPSDRGNVVMIFALSLLPLIALVGGMLDFSRARSHQSLSQDALDATVLAAAIDSVGGDLSDTTPVDLTSAYRPVYDAMLEGEPVSVQSLTVERIGETVSARVTIRSETIFLGLIGLNQFSATQNAEVTLGERSFEIALALDTTGSMAGPKMTRLKSAATQLVSDMSARVSDRSKLRFALVPFANFVNVGAGRRGAGWIDNTGLASYHHEIFDIAADRFDVYDHLGIGWPGCVESRPSPYDVTDERPRSAVPDTLFVPAFHPDEPDSTIDFPNTYLTDTSAGDDDDVTFDAAKYGIFSTSPASWVTASVSRTPYIFYSNYTHDQGPDFSCASQPVQPLTTNYAAVTTQINALDANGGTNLVEGITWGWRVLSAQEPFTEGRPDATADNVKVIILLSDGLNGINAFPTDLGSE